MISDGFVGFEFAGSLGDSRASDIAYSTDAGRIYVGGTSFDSTHMNRDFALAAFTETGGVDHSFTASGTTLVDFQGIPDWFGFGVGSYESLNRILVQPDGSILLAGYVENPNFFPGGAAIARVTSGGVLDTSFGSVDGVVRSGRVIENGAAVGLPIKSAEGIALHNDGILIAASAIERMAIFRQNSNGTVDSLFGSAGISDFYVDRGDARDIGVQTSGAIVLTGFGYDPVEGKPSLITARWNANGSKDPGWGTDGIVVTKDVSAAWNVFPRMTLLIQPDGNILVGGDSAGRASSDLLFVRLIGDPTVPSGTLSAEIDPGTGGLEVTDISAAGRNNRLTVDVSGGLISIRDVQETFVSAPAGWTLSADRKEISAPAAAFDKQIIINGQGGADHLELSGDAQGIAAYSFTGPVSGSVSRSAVGTIVWAGIESLRNVAPVADMTLGLPTSGGDVRFFLEDDGTTGNALTRFRADRDLITPVEFLNPDGVLTVLRGQSTDDLTVDSVPDFTAGLTIGADSSRLDEVTFDGAVLLGADKNLSVFASGAVTLPNSSSSTIRTVANGEVFIDSTHSILLSNRARIQSDDGDIRLLAQQPPTFTPAGVVEAIRMGDESVVESDTGDVHLTGQSTGSIAILMIGTLHAGGGSVFVNASSTRNAGMTIAGIIDAGTQVVVVGTSLTGPGIVRTHGVFLDNAKIHASGPVDIRGVGAVGVTTGLSGITSVNDSVSIDGTGLVSPGIGIRLSNSTRIVADGSVIVRGTGTFDTDLGGRSRGILAEESLGGFVDVTITSNHADVSILGSLNLSGIVPAGLYYSVDAAVEITAENGIEITGVTTSADPNSDLVGVVRLDGTTARVTTDGSIDVNSFAEGAFAGTSAIDVSQAPTLLSPSLGSGNSREVRLTAGEVWLNQLLQSEGPLRVFTTGNGISAPNHGFDVNTLAAVPAIGSNVMKITPGSILHLAVDGTTVDTQYDQLNVDGKVDLADAVLQINGAHEPAAGDVFTLVNTTQGLTGRFAGLPNNKTIPFNGRFLQLNYTPTSVTATATERTAIVAGDEVNNTLDVDLVAGTYRLNGGGITPLDGANRIDFDGGAGGGVNKLYIDGKDVRDAGYVPGEFFGDGTIRIPGLAGLPDFTINFFRLTPVDFDGFGTLTIQPAGVGSKILVSDDFNTALTSDLKDPGTVPAWKISGTSGGVGFEQAHLFRSQSLTLDTSTTDGEDTITFAADTSTLNTPFMIKTGAGSDAVVFDHPVRLADLRFEQIDLGSGANLLRFAAAGNDLDLTALPENKLLGVQQIDFRGYGSNRLKLSPAAIAAISDPATRMVELQYDLDDIAEFGEGWRIGEPIFVGDSFRSVVESIDGSATLMVNSDRPFKNPLLAGDVNRDGIESALDALNIINYLGQEASTEASRLADGGFALPTPQAGVLHRYLDPIGNGYASSLGALRILNSIARRSPGSLPSGEAESTPATDSLVPSPSTSIGTLSMLPLSADDDAHLPDDRLIPPPEDLSVPTKWVAATSVPETELPVDTALLEWMEEQSQDPAGTELMALANGLL